MTYRYYLQDMAFACALDVPEAYADEIIAGLQNPVWPICLGRRNCVPTDIVYRGRFDSQEEALAAAGEIAQAKRRAERFRVAHGRVEGGDVLTLHAVSYTHLDVYKRQELHPGMGLRTNNVLLKKGGM